MSGQSARVIGFSPTAAASRWSSSSGARTSRGHGWGANGWRANSTTAGSTLTGRSAMSDRMKVAEQIASEADTTADQPMPPEAVFTRPNKSFTVATRLSPEDLAEIERLAGRVDVPPSSLIRGWILSGLNAHSDETVQSTIEKITADVQRLRELVA
jgi:hypothetical protein